MAVNSSDRESPIDDASTDRVGRSTSHDFDRPLEAIEREHVEYAIARLENRGDLSDEGRDAVASLASALISTLGPAAVETVQTDGASADRGSDSSAERDIASTSEDAIAGESRVEGRSRGLPEPGFDE